MKNKISFVSCALTSLGPVLSAGFKKKILSKNQHWVFIKFRYEAYDFIKNAIYSLCESVNSSDGFRQFNQHRTFDVTFITEFDCWGMINRKITKLGNQTIYLKEFIYNEVYNYFTVYFNKNKFLVSSFHEIAIKNFFPLF